MALRMPKVVMIALALAAFLVSPWTGDVMARDKRLNNSLTIEQITDRVTQDLRPGVPLVEVQRYFSENDVEYGYYRDSNRVLEMIKNIKGGQFLIDKDAQIVVKLDEAHEVSSVEVKPVFTGP